MEKKKPSTSGLKSKREFCIFFSGSMPHGSNIIHSLDSIVEYSRDEDYEWAHSIMEIIDDVLDLRISDVLTFFPNRDEAHGQRREIGIIKRIR